MATVALLQDLADEGSKLGEHELPTANQVRGVLAALIKRAEAEFDAKDQPKGPTKPGPTKPQGPSKKPEA